MKFILLMVLGLSPLFASAQSTPREILQKVLQEDLTNLQEYRMPDFTCHNFAKMVYLQRSSLVNELSVYSLDGIVSNWGVKIERTPEALKLPIYLVNLSYQPTQSYHAINALLIDSAHPEKLESYLFFEPQTDQIFGSSDELYLHYARDFGINPLANPAITLQIHTFDRFTRNEETNRYQSFTSLLQEFQVSL